MTTVNTLGGWADSSNSGLMFRNKIINGNFTIWQRGTSFSSPVSYTYTADRWLTDGAATSVTRSGSQNNVLSIVTQAGTGIAQRVETAGGNFYAGQVYTVSALVNCTNADLTITVTYRDSNTFKSTIHTANVSSQVVAGQYTRVSTTFTLANAPTDFANTNCIQVSFTSTAVNTINFQNVQMEAGSQATPFEQRPIGLELSLCQRYYQVWSFITSGPLGFVESSTTSLHYWMFQVPLRSTTISCSSSGSFEIRRGGTASSSVSSFTFETSHNSSTRFLVTSSSLTVGQCVALASSSFSVPVSLTASAEL